MIHKPKSQPGNAIGMPKAPWIYVCDDTLGQTLVKGLLALIPEASYCHLDKFSGSTATTKHPLIIAERTSTVLIAEKAKHAKSIRTEAITRGCNFASVSSTGVATRLQKNELWGTNHLDVPDTSDAAVKVYKWLCK